MNQTETYYMTHRKLIRSYYGVIQKQLIDQSPDSIIEIGGGHLFISMLYYYPCNKRLFVDIRSKLDCGDTLFDSNDIEYKYCDVITDEHDFGEFDISICSHVLEHLENPKEMVDKIFKYGKKKIFIVPYMWTAHDYLYHIQQEIDEKKMRSWFDKDPSRIEIIYDKVAKPSLVFYYD